MYPGEEKRVRSGEVVVSGACFLPSIFLAWLPALDRAFPRGTLVTDPPANLSLGPVAPAAAAAVATCACV